jgi:hypothetical protein
MNDKVPEITEEVILEIIRQDGTKEIAGAASSTLNDGIDKIVTEVQNYARQRRQN